MLKEVKFCGTEGIRPYVKGGQISFEKEANILMIKEVPYFIILVKKDVIEWNAQV